MATGGGAGGVSLDPRMTNASHHVAKFAFVGYDESTGLKSRFFNVRQQMKRQFPAQREQLWNAMAPLDNRTFTMTQSGYSPQHYLRVVLNRWVDGELFYTFTAANRLTEA